MTTSIRLPAVYQVDEERHGNRIQQLAAPASTIEGDISGFRSSGVRGRLVQPAGENVGRILLLNRPANNLEDFPHVILQSGGDAAVTSNTLDLSGGNWLKHPRQLSAPIARHK